jgi:PKD repeat protein
MARRERGRQLFGGRVLHRIVVPLIAALCWFSPASASALEPSLSQLASTPAQRATAVSGAAPQVTPIASMKVLPGGTAEQTIHATDSDGDPLTLSKGTGPDYMTVTTVDPGTGTATGTIHLAPLEDAVIGHISASVMATDGALQDEQAFTIFADDNLPSLDQPEDMTVEPLHQADQILQASDPDQDPLTFSLVSGPWFVKVTTTGPGVGNVRLTPAFADSGSHQVSVAVSDGLAWDVRTFTATVLPGTIPIMDALNDMTVSPGQVLSQYLSGGDLDGDRVWFSKEVGPSFMTVVGGGVREAGGYIKLSPTLADEPTADGGDFDFPATVSLSDGRFTTRRSFTIHIHFPGSHPPVLAQPADIYVDEGFFQRTGLDYSDPDPEPLTVSVVGPEFVSLGYTSGVLFAEPDFDDAGTYSVTVRVTDSRGLYDEKTLQVIVNESPAIPSIETPMDMLVFAGRTAEQDLHARDPEGYPLSFWKPLGPDYVAVETIDPGAGSALGRIRVSPTMADIGRRDWVDVMASNRAQSAETYCFIEVADPTRLALMHPYDPCVSPRDSITVWYLAADPDGNPVSFHLSGLLPWMTFLDHGNGTAALVLQPTIQDGGVKLMVVTVTNGTSSVSQAFAINVGSCGGFGGGSTAPVSVPGGPYSGFVGDPIPFDGTQSTDPGGHSLSMVWTFGDGSVANSTAPEHTYSRAGVFQVDLIVSNGLAASRVSTTASIADALAARAVAPEGRTKIRLNAGRAPLEVWVEPAAGFQVADIDLGTLAMEYDGTGVVDAIEGVPTSSPATDHDGNGRPEIAVSFSREGLRGLFSSIAGSSEITATVKGRTLAGAPFRASLPLSVVAGRGKVSAALYPNPLNPGATLSFTMRELGPVHVTVFDLQGRLVRTLLNEDSAPAGYHEVRIEGRDGGGAKLASGVYFYRIETRGDVTTGRFAVLK